ncbi:MAG: alkaline phosphatase family protein [Candidatus Cybelea sp.]
MAFSHKAALAGLVFIAACGAQTTSDSFGFSPPNLSARLALPDAKRIQHVVILIQENRSFDNLFETFPGADGATSGKMSNGQTVRLKKSDLAFPVDLNHNWLVFLRDYDNGKMDGFSLENNGKGGYAGPLPYRYVDPKQIAPYWDMARAYVLADHMFQTQGSGSYTAHQDLIRGNTAIDANDSIIDFPSQQPWGCDSPKGTTTTLLTTSQKLLPNAGPFPCLEYRTLRDLLDAKGISWKYYSPRVEGSTGAVWNAFDSIKAVRYGRQWKTNVTSTSSAIFKHISEGTLPAVSWIVPTLPNSDHPGHHYDQGPSWVANVVNAIGESRYWKTSAIVIVWDDWGGFYDNVAPPFRDHGGGLGFRVPMLVVSPYARKGHISHTQYEFASILKFVEDNWKLGRLGVADVRAKSIGDCFDFAQRPRKFVPITAKYSRAFFEHQPPSNQPVDTE